MKNPILKLIRFILGYTIIILSAIFRPRQLQRSNDAKKEIDKQTKSMYLYQFYLCPFCVKVRRHIHRLNLNIDFRDAKDDPKHRQDLLEGGGRLKVPCLRIDEGDNTSWLYESSDINDYLSSRFLA